MRNIPIKELPVLVVDDISTNRQMIINYLKQLGIENFHEASDGQKALEKIKVQEFSLIVSDWQMPNMEGLELLKQLKSEQYLERILFVMLTPEADKNLTNTAMQEGATCCIAKPLNSLSFLKAIDKLF